MESDTVKFSEIKENNLVLGTQRYLENQEKFKKAFETIDQIIEKLIQQQKNLNKLKLSMLQEKNKNSNEFYLARKKKKEIKLVMLQYLKLYRLAFDKDPDFYYKSDTAYSIENFWAIQRGTWNKAHNLKWSNNRDLEGRIMEYKR